MQNLWVLNIELKCTHSIFVKVELLNVINANQICAIIQMSENMDF